MLSLNEAICGTLSQGSKSIWDGVLKKREGLSAFQLEEAEDAKLVALTLSGNQSHLRCWCGAIKSSFTTLSTR